MPWALDLLQRAEREPRNTHGCVGNDNAAFNWLLWSDCRTTNNDFTSFWNDTRKCERMLTRSAHATKLACAPLSTYPQHFAKAKRLGPVFRVHAAGSQNKKVAIIYKYLNKVKKGSYG